MPWSGPTGPDFLNFASSAAASSRAFGIDVDDGVELGALPVVGLDPLQVHLDELLRRQLAGLEGLVDVGNGRFFCSCELSAMAYCLFRQDHLGAAEQGDVPACLLVPDAGVPDHGAPADVSGSAFAEDGAVAGRAEEIGFQLDRGEAPRAFGEVDDGRIAADRVGQGDDGGRMQVIVGGQVVLLDLHAGDDPLLRNRHQRKAQKRREVSLAAAVHELGQFLGGKVLPVFRLFRVIGHGQRPRVRMCVHVNEDRKS